MIKHSLSIFITTCQVIAILPAAAEATKADGPTSKPNIIFVIADDMGCMDTGYSGNPVAKTPHLDQMAAAGLRFENFYSAHTTCSPGRMAMWTCIPPCSTSSASPWGTSR